MSLEQALETLTIREEKVIRRRYGLDGSDPQTFQMIGTWFGVTRERIRQIHAKALRQLRHPSRSKFWIDDDAMDARLREKLLPK